MKRSGEISAMTALAIVACIAVGAYAWLTWRKEGPPAWAADPGVAKGVVRVGEYVVLIDAVTAKPGDRGVDATAAYRSTRLTVVDASTGDRGRAMEIPNFVGCRAATPTRMWCSTGHVELFELPSLEPILSVEAAILKAGHGAAVGGAWAIEGAPLYQQLASGKAVTIDPTTLAITSAATMPSARKNITEPDTSCERLRGAWTAALGSNTCESVAVLGGMHVVTTTSPAGRVMGIEHGTVRWTTGLP